MKIFVTGVGGQLGHDVMNVLAERGHDGVGSDIAPAYSGVRDGSAVCDMPYVPMDITDAESVNRVLNAVKPDAVIHCAAWTAVDAAEDAANRPKVLAVNTEGTRHIAQACRALDCKLMYISTDYVFNGQGTEPWQPDCVDYAPLNVYGESKLGGFRNRDLPAGGHGCERRCRDHCRIRAQQGRAPLQQPAGQGKAG